MVNDIFAEAVVGAHLSKLKKNKNKTMSKPGEPIHGPAKPINGGADAPAAATLVSDLAPAGSGEEEEEEEEERGGRRIRPPRHHVPPPRRWIRPPWPRRRRSPAESGEEGERG